MPISTVFIITATVFIMSRLRLPFNKLPLGVFLSGVFFLLAAGEFDPKEIMALGVAIAYIFAAFDKALVTWLGKTFPTFITGTKQFAASMIIGFLSGAPSMYFIAQPKAASDWFAVILVGLSVGLVASGLYNSEKEAATKGAAELLGRDPRGQG